MKKYILILTLVFLPLVSFCQLLMLGDLKSLYGKEVDVINEELTAKGWVYEGKSHEKNNDYHINWVYKKSDYSTGKTGKFIVLMVNGKRLGVVLYSNKKDMDWVKNEATAGDMKKKPSEFKDNGAITTDYYGKDYFLKFNIYPDEVYNVILVANDLK